MWHEARRSERKVHDMMDATRKRAQRRAIFLAKRRGDPQQSIQVAGSRCRIQRDDALYHATQDEQGLFDGRALLDFIREPGTRHFRKQQKSEEEKEVEEFVNFERYRDLIKHHRRGFTDEDGLQHVNLELEAKVIAPFQSGRPHSTQPINKGSYSQVGFSYDGNGKEEAHSSDADEEDEDDFNSDDSNDEGMDVIAKEFGVKRYAWLVYMDKKAKGEEKRQKEVIKGDPAIRKLSRKERKKASQIEREKEREDARITESRVLHNDPYRESRRSSTYDAYPHSRRSRSRSYSPSHSGRHTRGGYSDNSHRSKPRAPKLEYITEFGGSGEGDGSKLEGFSPPSSPPSQSGMLNRPSSGHILEALHVDPASAKLTKASASGGHAKQGQVEKKETPQERLKRIMNRQLNKQIKKDTVAEIAKKREQERQRLEKLAETTRLSFQRHRSRSRSYSRSPPRGYRRSRSPSRSSRRHYSRSRSRSHSHSCSRSNSHSPRVRSHSRY